MATQQAGSQAKPKRDDFPKTVKEQLGRRVGFLCSSPECGAVTTGPSSKSNSASKNIGDAAHICAASEGGARYKASMTSKERKSIENGIWLCKVCAKEIDDDELHYTEALLKDWKSKAESRANELIGERVFGKKYISEITDNLKKSFYETYKIDTEKIKEQLMEVKNVLTNLVQGKTHATQPESDAAFIALRKGDLSLALSLFEAEAERFEKEEAQKGAEIQRNVGTLAFFSYPQKSLKAYRRATELDPDNANGWNQLGNVLHLTGNPKEAIIAYQNVLKMGKKNQKPKEVAAAHNGLGTIYKYNDRNKAIECYKKALSIGEDFEIQEIIATACENIAVAYCENRDFDEAIKLYQRALKINEEINDREGMASNYLNLGTMYYDRERYTNTNSKNFDVAIQHLNDALDISKSLKDQEKIAIIYGALGNVHQKCNDFDKSIGYYDKALKINEDLGRKEGVAVQYENLGNLWITKDLDKAFNHYNDALKINEHLGIQSRIALDYANMGLVRKRQNKYAEARQYWQQSIALDSQHTATVQVWLDALPE